MYYERKSETVEETQLSKTQPHSETHNHSQRIEFKGVHFILFFFF